MNKISFALFNVRVGLGLLSEGPISPESGHFNLCCWWSISSKSNRSWSFTHSRKWRKHPVRRGDSFLKTITCLETKPSRPERHAVSFTKLSPTIGENASNNQQRACPSERRGTITLLHYAADQVEDLGLLLNFFCSCSSSIQDLTARCWSVVHVAMKNKRFGAINVLKGWLLRAPGRDLTLEESRRQYSLKVLSFC